MFHVERIHSTLQKNNNVSITNCIYTYNLSIWIFKILKNKSVLYQRHEWNEWFVKEFYLSFLEHCQNNDVVQLMVD